jgi:hypothetical protein
MGDGKELRSPRSSPTPPKKGTFKIHSISMTWTGGDRSRHWQSSENQGNEIRERLPLANHDDVGLDLLEAIATRPLV